MSNITLKTRIQVSFTTRFKKMFEAGTPTITENHSEVMSAKKALNYIHMENVKFYRNGFPVSLSGLSI